MKATFETCADESVSISITFQPSKPARILVVDDDSELREIMAKSLALSGYEVAAAEDGAAAWDALQSSRHDLLVTDHSMCRLTGIELVKKLRAAHMVLPVILISGFMPTEELKKHPWLLIDATLQKPFTVAELVGTVKQVLCATKSRCGPFAPAPNLESSPQAAADRFQCFGNATVSDSEPPPQPGSDALFQEPRSGNTP